MMLDIAIKITALFGAAWAASVLLRGHAASIRHAVWSGLLAAALALPLCAALAPPFELAWLPAPQGMQRLAPDAALGLGRDVVARPVAAGTAAAATRTPQDAAPVGFHLTASQGLAGVWLLVAMLFVTRIVVAHMQVRRMLDACIDPPARLESALASVARELHVRVPPLRMSAAGTMPAVIGVLRPSVVVPADAMSWSAERLRLVLLHECAHVRRRDALLQVIASLATAAYWWHPLTWVAARRVVRERELACDDLVIATGTSGSDYASHLIDIARALKPSRQPAMAALAMARPSELEGRLIALLEERPRRLRPARALLLGLGLALVALVGFAPLKLVARGPAPSPPAEQASSAALVAEADHDAQPARGAHTVADAQAATDAQPAAQTAPVRRSRQVDVTPASKMDAAFTDALLRALDDEDADNRMLAIIALSRTQRAEVVPVLTQILEDGKPDMRAFALLHLIQMEREEARAFLPRALRDESSHVRATGLIGLRKLNHPERRALALRAGADSSDQVRALAALILAEEAGPEVDAMVVTLSKDPSSHVRRAALLAMTKRFRDER